MIIFTLQIPLKNIVEFFPESQLLYCHEFCGRNLVSLASKVNSPNPQANTVNKGIFFLISEECHYFLCFKYFILTAGPLAGQERNGESFAGNPRA
jgi:hypothetical protein